MFDAKDAENVLAEKWLLQATSTLIKPGTMTPFAVICADGERREVKGLLGGNATSRSFVESRYHQAHDADQHRVGEIIELCYPNPLGRVEKLGSRNLK